MKPNIQLRKNGTNHWWVVRGANGRVWLTSETYASASNSKRSAMRFASACGGMIVRSTY